MTDSVTQAADTSTTSSGADTSADVDSFENSMHQMVITDDDGNVLGDAPENVESESDLTDAALEHDASTANKSAIEELFEVISGKDANGKPITHKLSKADLLKNAGMGIGSRQQAEKVAQERKQVSEILQALRDPANVFDILKGLGNDPEKLMEDYVQKRITEALEDPKDREARLDREELENYRKTKAQQMKEQQEQQEIEAANTIQKDLETKINESLTAAKLPNTGANRAEVAKVIQDMYNDAITNKKPFDLKTVPYDKVVKHLRDSRVSGFEGLINEADDDALLETIPQALRERIARAESKRLSSQHGKVNNTITPNNRPTNESREESKPFTFNDWNAQIKADRQKADNKRNR